MTFEASPNLEAKELEWETVCREAYVAYTNGDCDEAAIYWRRAGVLTERFAPDDPRRSTGLNNIGLGYFLDNDFDKSEAAFKEALEGWRNAKHWATSMEITGTAKSSLFHHRLEVRHNDDFKNHNRMRYCSWIEGAEAITAFNLSTLLVGLERKTEAMDMLSMSLKLRENVVGAGDAELAAILETMAGTTDNDETSAGYLERAQWARSNPTRNSLERWDADRPYRMTDTRRLLGAICLTAMVSERDFLQDKTS